MRFQTQRMQNGVVVQAGLDQRPRNMPLPLDTNRGPYRAVVLNVYASVDPQSFRRKSIECDLRTIKGNVTITHAVVLQKSHGVDDADCWFPRPSTKTVTGAPLESSTLYGDYDGDIVLVDFIEGSSEFPVVIGALPHEQSLRKPIAGPGWSEADLGVTRGVPMLDERYSRHGGAEIRTNSQGDVLIDTVDALSGQVRIRLKDLQKFTIASGTADILEVYKGVDGLLHVDLGEGATEEMVLGGKLLQKLTALTVSTAFGPSSTPINAAEFPEFLSPVNKTK